MEPDDLIEKLSEVVGQVDRSEKKWLLPPRARLVDVCMPQNDLIDTELPNPRPRIWCLGPFWYPSEREAPLKIFFALTAMLSKDTHSMLSSFDTRQTSWQTSPTSSGRNLDDQGTPRACTCSFHGSGADPASREHCFIMFIRDPIRINTTSSCEIIWLLSCVHVSAEQCSETSGV